MSCYTALATSTTTNAASVTPANSTMKKTTTTTTMTGAASATRTACVNNSRDTTKHTAKKIEATLRVDKTTHNIIMIRNVNKKTLAAYQVQKDVLPRIYARSENSNDLESSSLVSSSAAINTSSSTNEKSSDESSRYQPKQHQQSHMLAKSARQRRSSTKVIPASLGKRSQTRNEFDSLITTARQKSSMMMMQRHLPDANQKNKNRLLTSSSSVQRRQTSSTSQFTPVKRPLVHTSASSQQLQPLPQSNTDGSNKLAQRTAEIKQLKKQQRNQIYALNELMRSIEHENFVEFCRENDIQVNYYD